MVSVSRAASPGLDIERRPLGWRRLEAWEREAAFQVHDLSCRACARRAREALRRVPGVVAASIGLLRDRADVRYDVRITSPGEIVATMAAAGFRVHLAPALSGAPLGGLDLGIGLVALVNILLLTAASGPGPDAAPVGIAKLVLAGLVLAVGGFPVGRRAISRLKQGILDRDALTAAGALVAFGVGVIELGFARRGAQFLPSVLSALGFRTAAWQTGRSWGFEACAGILVAALATRLGAAAIHRVARTDLRARARAQNALARRLDADGRAHPASADELAAGDRILLVEGERAPADLHLEAPVRVAREASPGQLLSQPLEAGEVIPAGAVLLSAAVTGRVVHPRGGLAGALDAEVHASLARAEEAELFPADPWEDAAARGIFTAALGCAAFAAVTHGWLGGGPLSPLAIFSCVAVLVGSSPSAIVVAAPVARAVAVLRARAAGVVVKDPGALQALAAIDVACFEHTLWAHEPTVRALSARGITARLLAGEHPDAAGLPAEKALAIRDLQLGGARVLLIGDGWNDSAGADVAVAVAPGTLPGAVRAPIVVCDGRVDGLPALVDRGRALRAVLRQNAALAAVYNAALLPAAALGYLSPLRAAALMLLETLLGLANASRLLHTPKA
jgi:cation transport ATPase